MNQIIGKEKRRRELAKEYDNTNRLRLLKRYRLMKEMRQCIDSVHLEGAYSILYTIVFTHKKRNLKWTGRKKNFLFIWKCRIYFVGLY